MTDFPWAALLLAAGVLGIVWGVLADVLVDHVLWREFLVAKFVTLLGLALVLAAFLV